MGYNINNLLTSCLPHSDTYDCRFRKRVYEDVVFYTWEKCELHGKTDESGFDP